MENAIILTLEGQEVLNNKIMPYNEFCCLSPLEMTKQLEAEEQIYFLQCCKRKHKRKHKNNNKFLNRIVTICGLI